MMVRLQGGVTGVNSINPEAPVSLGLSAHDHQLVNFSLLVVVLATVKQCGKCASDTII